MCTIMRKRIKQIREIPKPWGKEIWFAWTDKYAGKILVLNKGHRFSLQYHAKKEETQFILEGKVKVTIGKMSGKAPGKLTSKTLKAGQKIDIPAKTIHRVDALTDCVILEVSTPELTDVVKLADDYGRSGKGNNPTLDKKLAGKKKPPARLKIT
ncbi:MAG: cupin [Patescibacteria group bacterium]